MMRKTIRGKRIILISKQRITQTTFLILVLILGLAIAPVSYAENHIASSTKAIYGPVKGSDTLGKIVSRNYSGSNLSQQQIMMGILRTNPDAFIGGNIHFLLRGSNLLLPDEKLIATIDKTEATNTIKEHYRYFLKGQTGNFKILPLEDLSSSVDEATTKENTDIVISSQNEKKTKVDEIERLIQNRQLAQNIETVVKKSTEVVKATAQIKRVASNNSINDIELESLKIKVSQLEKILSRRGLSASSNGATGKITSKLQNTLNTQKQKIDQLELEKKNKTGELEQLKGKIAKLEISLEKMSQSLTLKGKSGSGNEKNIISQLKKENTKLQKQLSSLQLELDKKTQEVKTLNIDIKNSKQTIGKLEAKLLNTDKENALLDKQIAAVEEKLEQIRQTTPNSNTGVTSESRSGISPWTWLLPALFLLSILGYLFKRSFSQPEKVTVSDAPVRKVQSNSPPRAVVKESYKKSSAAIQEVPDVIASASEEESIEASIKLDIAKAYMDMEMPNEAIEILHEIPEEGSQKQCLEANNLLEKLAA